MKADLGETIKDNGQLMRQARKNNRQSLTSIIKDNNCVNILMEQNMSQILHLQPRSSLSLHKFIEYLGGRVIFEKRSGELFIRT